MRAILACLSAMALLSVAAAFAPEPTSRITLTLTDAESGRPIAGVVRLSHEADGKRTVLTPPGSPEHARKTTHVFRTKTQRRRTP